MRSQIVLCDDRTMIHMYKDSWGSLSSSFVLSIRQGTSCSRYSVIGRDNTFLYVGNDRVRVMELLKEEFGKEISILLG